MKILVILCVAYVLRLCGCESLDDIIARFDGEVAKTQKLLEDAQSTLKGAENALEEYTKACTEIQSSKGKEVEDARKAFETAQKTLGKVSGSDAVLQALKKALEDLDKGAKFEPPSVESQGKVVKEALEKVADIHDLLNTVKPLEKLDEGNHEQQSSGTTPVDAKPKVVEHTTVSTSDPVEKSPTEENVSEQDTPKDTEKTSNSAPEESRESVSNEPNETQSEEVTLQKPVEESKTHIEEDVTTTDEAKSEDLKPEKESQSLGSSELIVSTMSTVSKPKFPLNRTGASATLKLLKPDYSIYQFFEYHHDDNHIRLVIPRDSLVVTKILNDTKTIWSGKRGEVLEYAKVYLNKDKKPELVLVTLITPSGVLRKDYIKGTSNNWKEFKGDVSTKINPLKVTTEHKRDSIIDLKNEKDTYECRIFSVIFLGVPTRSYSPKPGYIVKEVMDGEISLWKAAEGTDERCLSCELYTKYEHNILYLSKRKHGKRDDASFEFSDGTWKSISEEEFLKKFQAMANGSSKKPKAPETSPVPEIERSTSSTDLGSSKSEQNVHNEHTSETKVEHYIGDTDEVDPEQPGPNEAKEEVSTEALDEVKHEISEHASTHTDVISKDTKTEGDNNYPTDQNDDAVFSTLSTAALGSVSSDNGKDRDNEASEPLKDQIKEGLGLSGWGPENILGAFVGVFTASTITTFIS
ncbi:hypothetical protein BEWA_054930 [Theileria equi strain WA]|uniref:Signal peptide containing protein n=1 Tax=Theileria equi strain WA TaxID=1537102 RepID=L1LDF5_THEEQ|nr:hypothetical protein BEWA_053490 [Theileria equi strain WA]XP_004832888.1 hypothetical protein BEWA_054930 [Theileria equi strain WA]EKX73294.1 hypothetical protein BEWA_053490 [Theileria equi strain WA]EKX73436.1 hypothetical protein BEWA_054930 [Theileria equi strain WA]|eukprot:XP_004832746.1 hypothetical protein BEWA_053490 [Theileria equi strain WA]